MKHLFEIEMDYKHLTGERVAAALRNYWQKLGWPLGLFVVKKIIIPNGSNICPRCHRDNPIGPDENGDIVCLDCGWVFDQDERTSD